MVLAVGNKVNYPSHGPCLISSIVNKVVNDKTMTFYQLLVLNDGGGTLLIPVNSSSSDFDCSSGALASASFNFVTYV